MEWGPRLRCFEHLLLAVDRLVTRRMTGEPLLGIRALLNQTIARI